MYHSAMSNSHIRMRNIAESLQNNVTYAIRSTSLLCTWRLKVKSYNGYTRNNKACSVAKSSSKRQHVSRMQPSCAYDIAKVAICHSQRVCGQLHSSSSDHKRTKNQVSSELCKSMMNFLEKFSVT